MKRLTSLALIGLVVAGCQSDRIASPTNSGVATAGDALAASRAGYDGYRLPPPSAGGLRVMTYNLYLGTDLGPILQAGSEQAYLIAAVRAYAELQQTDFPARAGRIAEEIADVRPDLVGLQEVALWSVSSPYDPTQPPLAPFVVRYDFLQLVLDSLRAHHLRYVAASTVATSDVAAPVPTAFDATGIPTAFDLVRFQDHDVILARADVRFRDPQHGVYAAYIPLSLLGNTAALHRGWCSVRATVDGKTFRFVNSHLEAESPDVNLAQAGELVGLLEHVRDPVIWVGDFNSDADGDGASYDLATRAGFTDLWPLAHPRDPGLTNGSADGVGALDGNGVLVPYPALVFDKRIDLVLVRDRDRRSHDVHAAIFGNQLNDRTASGLWPSDHAAVGMVFELPDYFAHDWHRDRR